MVYENVKTQRSYNSFPQSVAVRHLDGTNIGFQNHSAAFPPKIIDCMYEVYKNQFSSYLNMQTPFGTILPFSLVCDKDTSQGRSRQVSGIRFPCFDNKLRLPFVNVAYIGHPACNRFDGGFLAQKTVGILTELGISVQHANVGHRWSISQPQYY